MPHRKRRLFQWISHRGHRACVVLLLLSTASQLLPTDADFLKVFPPSPAIPNLVYTGQFSHTQSYSPSGSVWAPNLDEREVFFASLKHVESAGNSWEVRIGKGGQLYSI